MLPDAAPCRHNNWSYTVHNPFGMGTTNITLRGYTFHEHLPHFSLVNMNGRLYDNVLCRMLSPDNFIQAPNNTQSFNRYSYCWNNPLKYTDPSGEIIGTIFTATFDFAVTALFKGGLDPTSSNARNNAWTNYDPTKRGTKTNNAWRIDKGRFKTNPNKPWYERVGQLFLRFTWEAPQSGLGYFYSHLRNVTGNVTRVEYFDGATFVVNEESENRDGVSMGNYININQRRRIEGDFTQHVINDPLYMHEFGHTFDSRRFGPIYLLAIGLPSLYSAATIKQVPNEPDGVTTHDFRWYEMRANRHARDYFGANYGVDWENRPMRVGTYETYYPTRRR